MRPWLSAQKRNGSSFFLQIVESDTRLRCAITHRCQAVHANWQAQHFVECHATRWGALHANEPQLSFCQFDAEHDPHDAVAFTQR